MSLDRRTQILLDAERYRALEGRARERGSSVAAVIRDAIDKELGDDPAGRAEAVRDLLSLPPAPMPDWPELEREIEESYERGASHAG